MLEKLNFNLHDIIYLIRSSYITENVSDSDFLKLQLILFVRINKITCSTVFRLGISSYLSSTSLITPNRILYKSFFSLLFPHKYFGLTNVGREVVTVDNSE